MAHAAGPLASVVIPAWNAAATITGAIDSALQQDGVVDVVVVDDGSTDSTVQLAEAVTDARVMVIHRSHTGVCAARNAGARAARGEWLIFLDADDELLPGAVAALAGDAHPSVVLACGRVRRTWRDGTQTITELPDPGLPLLQPLLAGSFAVRASTFAAAGGYDERLAFGENTDLGIRLRRLSPASSSVRLVDIVVATIRSDASVERSAAYSERVVRAAYHFLEHHDATLDAMRVRAQYAAVGGVAAARLRRWGEARRFFQRAVASGDRRWSDAGRLAVALLPGIRSLVWSPAQPAGRARLQRRRSHS